MQCALLCLLPSPQKLCSFLLVHFSASALNGAHSAYIGIKGRSFELLREDVVEKKDTAVSSVELSPGHISIMFCSFFPCG